MIQKILIAISLLIAAASAGEVQSAQPVCSTGSAQVIGEAISITPIPMIYDPRLCYSAVEELWVPCDEYVTTATPAPYPAPIYPYPAPTDPAPYPAPKES